jgi:hypothetical protein
MTAAIASIASYIAYRQWLTTHQSAVLNLFDRKMQIYDDARAAIGEVSRASAVGVAGVARTS